MDNRTSGSESATERRNPNAKRRVLSSLVLVALTILSSCDATAQELPPLKLDSSATETDKLDAVDKWLQELFEAGKFNGGILIARDGKAHLMKTYGFADARAERPLTIQTPFRLASVSHPCRSSSRLPEF